MSEVLRLESVSHRLPGCALPVLRGVNLALRAGEWVSLVGPSGSGKTTLGRICLGLLHPERGAVWRDQQLSVGWVAQDPTDMLLAGTVGEELDLGFAGTDASEWRRRCLQALISVGLPEDCIQRDPWQLSGGERQRVVIAAALVARRRLLVLDEPTSMLDRRAQEQVQAAVRQAVAQGAAVLYLTQDAAEAALADRVVMLDDGCVVDEGSPESVLAHPRVLESLGTQAPPLLRLATELRRKGIVIRPERWDVPGVSQAVCRALGVRNACG